MTASPAGTARRVVPGRPVGDTGSPPSFGFAARPLDPARHTSATARRFARSTLQGWGLHRLVDDVALTVSELVTNALGHGLTGPQTVRTPGATASPLTVQPVLLGLVRRQGDLLCAVFDPGTDIPTLQDPGQYTESGRGLQVVEMLSAAWGWTAPDHSGKAVWAMFSSFSTFATSSTCPRGSGPAVPHPSSAVARQVPITPESERHESDWDPLTRLLLLLEIVSDPPWLRELAQVTESGSTDP